MAKCWSWLLIFWSLTAAVAPVIPAGNLGLAFAPSASPFSAKGTQTLIAIPKEQRVTRLPQADSAAEKTGLEALYGLRQDDGPALGQMWARQNLTQVTIGSWDLAIVLTGSRRSSAQASLLITTVTVFRTVTVELAGQTEVVLSSVEQTLTFIDPILVFETRVITAPLSIAPNEPTETAAFDRLAFSAPHGHSPRHKGFVLSSTKARIRRQTPKPITGVSTVTVEVITTLTNTGSSVRTVVVLSPIFVSVTENPTVTSTRLITTTPSIETRMSGTPTAISPTPPAVPSPSLKDQDEPVVRTTFFTTIFPIGTLLSPSATRGFPTSTSVLGFTGTSTGLVPSETSATAGVTTWFTTFEYIGTAASESKSGSTTTIASSVPTALSTSEPVSGPDLAPWTIAIIVIVAVGAVALLSFLVYIYRGHRVFFGNRRHRQLSESYEMTPAVAGAAAMNPSASFSVNPYGQGQVISGETSSKSSGEGEQVRIIIRPVAIRPLAIRSSSSNTVSPPTRVWPRPPGFNGQAYSLSADGSGETTPRDATGWSLASEQGSTANREVSRGGGLYELAA
ncbi:gmc oxidoreductase [Colletotrichum tabaci]|uniref:Gmc oxidoreductase n=1 Tax=Colletotrichum tabaci TaxID=1209068 RepID=A0AAV9T270_9PEZI